MSLVNDVKKEIHAKIVYLGAKGAGKSTALRTIYSRLAPECRSELKCMASGEHQLLFFDFSPSLPQRSDGYTVRFHVYTLISGGDSIPPWKMLLKGADGVALFADSAEGRTYGNLECCTLLLDALTHYGLKLDDITLSLQCNKRDLTGAKPLAAIKNELFPELGEAALPVTALTGDGLLEGLNSTIKGIMRKLGGGYEEAPFTSEASEPISAGKEDFNDGITASLQHCTADNGGFAVEVAGTVLAVSNNTIVIPIRLTSEACGKSVDFKVTVAVNL